MTKLQGKQSGALELEKIRLLLKDRPRDLLFFEIATQTTANVSEILLLRVADLNRLNVNQPLPLNQKPWRATIKPLLTTRMKDYLLRYLAKERPDEHDFVFKSRKGNLPLTKTSASRIIRGWLEETGLLHLGGLRGLRYAQVKALSDNHSNPKYEERAFLGQVLPKIEIQTLQEAVYKELEKYIISGRIPPGYKLTIEEVARHMDVSRIPIREAFGRLEARGFISTQTKSGCVVNELSRSKFKEILDLRLLLESEAIASAAPQIEKETIDSLMIAHNEFAEARRFHEADRLLTANREFHMLAYKDAERPILINLINQLWNRVSPYYHIMFRQSLLKHPSMGVNYHNYIVKAMQEHDPEKAQHWLGADLMNSADFVLELFDLHEAQKNK